MIRLSKGEINKAYEVNSVLSDKEGVRDFLFTLGCYPGERITIISKLASNLIVNIKDARYSIDEALADAIEV